MPTDRVRGGRMGASMIAIQLDFDVLKRRENERSCAILASRAQFQASRCKVAVDASFAASEIVIGSDDQRSGTRAAGLVAAIDVGGTSMKGALVGADRRIVHEARRPTPRDAGPDAVVTAIGSFLEELLAVARARPSRDRPVSAGVVVPGIVDEEAGMARFSANVGWRDLPLAQQLEDAAGVPVVLGHDVRAGALAEHRLGAGRGVNGMLFLPLGYGIAAAIVADGRLVVAGGHAGEIGHVVVEPGGDRCGCGGRGCLETVASGSAIARRYARRRGLGQATDVGARDVAARARAGDKAAIAVWTEAVDALAVVIAMSVALLAPELVVVGGGLSLAGEQLLGPLRAAVPRHLSFVRVPPIVSATLGDRAGCLGAAILAQERVVALPRGGV
jgi:glucokinase